jgi:hypothetical protein
MKRVWVCGYSLVSLCLACANLLIVFGGTGAFSSQPPPIPHSGPYRHLVFLDLGLAWGSLGFAGLGAVRGEYTKLALVALGAGFCSLMLCTSRLSVYSPCPYGPRSPSPQAGWGRAVVLPWLRRGASVNGGSPAGAER